jgi:hypothetical protein
LLDPAAPLAPALPAVPDAVLPALPPLAEPLTPVVLPACAVLLGVSPLDEQPEKAAKTQKHRLSLGRTRVIMDPV